MKKIILSLFFLYLFSTNILAQITNKSNNISKFSYLPKNKEFIDINIKPSTKNITAHNCVGQLANCNLSFFNNAEKYIVDNGTLWRIGICSNGAKSLSIDFSNIKLNNNVEMCIYGGNDFLGIISQINNNSNHKLRTRFIDNDSITIELFVPNNITQPDFTISKISHGFYPVSKLLTLGENRECKHPDINGASGQNYYKEKHAIILYQFDLDDYTYVCTGALVNNIEYDATPYILSAAHCVCSNESAQSVVAYFNYERKSDQITDDSFQTMSGAELIAWPTKSYRSNLRTYYGLLIDEDYYNDYDISLMKLSVPPPKDYMPYYLGVSTNTKNLIDTVVTIHHPQGNQKTIAISNMPPYQDSYPISDEIFINNTHWHIDTWHTGYTDVGSSGAPLINQNKQIIGILSGGFATCKEPYDDYFQMISSVWNKNTNPYHQLQFWLANNQEITEIDSFDPYGIFSELPTADISGFWNTDSTAIELQWQTSNNQIYTPNFCRLYCNNTLIAEIPFADTINYTYTNILPKTKYNFYIENTFADTSATIRSNSIIFTNFKQELPTSINKIENTTKIKIFPNPTHNKINILLNTYLNNCKITIYTLSGKIVKTINTSIEPNIATEIDITNIKQGIYLIKIENSNLTNTQKIIIN